MKCTLSRAWLLLGILTFVGAYNWVYLTWLHPTFDYIGFAYEAPPWIYVVLAWGLSVSPAIWMPIVVRRPSQLILWVLYLSVFIPSMFVPLYAAYQPLNEVVLLMLALYFGFVLMSCGSLAPLVRIPSIRIHQAAVMPSVCLITLFLMAWVVVVFAGHFRLVSFGEVYQEIRFAGAEVAQGTGVGYAVMWLAGAFHPFLMTWGLIYRRPGYFMLGALGQVLLYCTAGLKIILLSTVLFPSFYLALAGRSARFGLRLTWTAVLVFLLLNSANLLVEDVGKTQFMLAALVFLRSFGLTGLTTAQYQDFFSAHPFTHFSHVKGLDALIDYPYQGPIGKEIGFFYSSNLDYNANAHLWAMDGLAGAGLWGVIAISILGGLVFWLLDNAARGHKPVFAAMTVCFAAFNLSNVSLFTSLFSGGLIFIILLLYLMPRDLSLEIPEAEVEPVPSLDSEISLSRLPSYQPSSDVILANREI
jgi:O-antigen polymerase